VYTNAVDDGSSNAGSPASATCSPPEAATRWARKFGQLVALEATVPDWAAIAGHGDVRDADGGGMTFPPLAHEA